MPESIYNKKLDLRLLIIGVAIVAIFACLYTGYTLGFNDASYPLIKQALKEYCEDKNICIETCLDWQHNQQLIDAGFEFRP